MTTVPFRFEIRYQSKKSRARVGRIHTPHGVIETPNFVAVGTNGTLKTLSNAAVNELDLQLMFCNTYHLLLQPGPDIVREAGGLHTFINRKGPIITDSGGFQVFSLAYGGVASELKSQGTKKQEGAVIKITEEGVIFRSYRDGQRITLTPESSIEAQKAFGADIIIPLDELPPYHISDKKLKASFDRTHRWELRSLATHLANPQQQAMYAVIHGGVDPILRRESCEILSREAFDGFAIGGSLGKTKQQLVETVAATVPCLPHRAPNHLLGIGDIESIEQCVPLGIDTFDSSYPTKVARHGMILTMQGKIKIEQKQFATRFEPIEAECPCSTCKNFTLAYLHHLFKAKEPTAHVLATLHNLAFMIRLMAKYRSEILSGSL
ncbi:MAG: tRNA guanosine(34) transglycosylase Tgt [Gammaproteobacteria bacterium]